LHTICGALSLVQHTLMKNLTLLLILALAISSCRKKDRDIIEGPGPVPPGNDSIYNYLPNTITGKFSTTFAINGNILVLASPFALHARPRNILLYSYSQDGVLQSANTVVLPDTGFYGPPAFYSVVQTTDGGYLLCGDAYKTEPYMGSFIYSTDVALLKLSASFKVEWLKTFGGGDEDHGQAIMYLKNDTYLLAGQSVSFNSTIYSDLYLLKVNGKGEEIWSHAYDIEEQQHLDDILQTTGGDIRVFATDKYGTGNSTAMLLATDADGNEQWHKTLATGNIDASGIVEIAGGYMASYNMNGDPHIMQLSNAGDVVWDKAGYLPAGGFQYAMAFNSMKTSGGNAVTLTGSQYHTGDSFAKTVVLKIDASGNKVFSRTLPVYYNNVGLNLLKAQNGNNIITGQITRDSTVSDVFFSKTNDY
jgi:hypothetical protein